jgi:hypothetical protein
MSALQVLHLGEEVAEMLAVLAALAEPGIRCTRAWLSSVPSPRRTSQLEL